MKKNGALVMLTKHPFAGFVKTRLGKHIGEDLAADLSWAMTNDMLITLKQVTDAAVYIALDEPLPGINAFQGFNVLDQSLGDLGQKLASIAKRILSKHDWVIFIGSDCPHMPLNILQDAILYMNQGKNVLGPTEDGGYYIQGLQLCPEMLFKHIPWSVSSTFASMFQAQKTYLSSETEILAQLFDIDEPDDLLKLKNLSGIPHTQKMIARIL